MLLGKALAPLPQPLAFWSDPIILEFAFGVALGWVSAKGGWINRPARLGLAIVGLALFALDLAQPRELLALPRPLAYGLPAAFLVAAAALASPERRSSENLLIRWGVNLGDASYALYLLHPFIIRALRELVTRTGIAALIGPWGFRDAVHSLRGGSRDMREPGFRAPDHAGNAAFAGTFRGEPILRGAGSRAEDRARAFRALGLRHRSIFVKPARGITPWLILYKGSVIA